MKVLVIGGGGREHALVRAIARSGRVSEILCAPGNAGIAQLARCIPANQRDVDDLLRVTAAESPDLVVVGPELPLSLGLVDELQRRGVAVFGPTRRAAQLESSKAFAKFIMRDPLLRPMTIYAAIANLAKSGSTAIVVVFLIRVAGFGSGAVGLLMATTGVGGIAGAMVARRVAGRLGTARALLLCMLGSGLFALLIPLTGPGPGATFYVVGAVMLAAGGTAGNIILVSFRQAYCPRPCSGGSPQASASSSMAPSRSAR